MKKVMALLLAAVMCLGVLTGCGKKDDSAPSTNSDAEEKPKVAFVSEKVGTMAFLVQARDAMEKKAEELGFELMKVECADTDAFDSNMRAAIEEGADLIICMGGQGSQAINAIANEFPDKCKYVLVDDEIDNDNVKCISYKEQEGAYLIGLIAGYATQNKDANVHEYGMVHVSQGQSSYKWRYAYMEGIKSIDPDSNFTANFVGSYSDPGKAKEFALQQATKGCVFINSAAAGGDSGTFEAAKEKGFYTSGQDVDLTSTDNEFIITSQLKNTGKTCELIVESFLDGSLDTTNETWGIKEGVIGAAGITADAINPAPLENALTAEQIQNVKDVAKEFESGARTLEVPMEQN